MKKFFVLSIFVLFLAGCSEEEKQLKLMSPMAEAYSLEEGYEVHGTIQARDYVLEEKNGKFAAKVKYEFDLVKPNGEITRSVASSVIDTVFNEEIRDIEIEGVFELNKSYATGNYKLVFKVEDLKSNSKASVEKEFELEL